MDVAASEFFVEKDKMYDLDFKTEVRSPGARPASLRTRGPFRAHESAIFRRISPSL